MSPAVDYSRLAELYDLLVPFEADIPFFQEECQRVGGRVLELMSGTGRVSVPLVTAGVDLTCVDSSPEMLQKLQDRLVTQGLVAKVVEQDVARLRLDDTFDLVIRHDAATGIVQSTESLPREGSPGESMSREELSLRYILIDEDDFRELAQMSGFSIRALFGDYDRSRFDPDVSPFMIWILEG